VATNPESRFIQKIHRQLKKLEPAVFIWKTSERFSKGIPDVIYIGPSGIILWVEYKVFPNTPTALQHEMLNNLREYEQKTAIITQHPTTTMIHTPSGPINTNEPWVWIAHTLGYEDDQHPRKPR